MKKFLAVLLVVAMVMALVPTMAFADESDTVTVVVVTKDAAANYFQFQADQVAIEAGETVTILVYSELGAVKESSSIRTLEGNGSITETGRYTPAVEDLGNNLYLVSAEASAAGVLAVRFYFEGQSDKIEGEVSIAIVSIGVGEDDGYLFEKEEDIAAAGLTKWTSMTPSFAIGEIELVEDEPAEPDVKVDAYTGELNSDVRSGVKLTDTLAVNDILSFFVKVVPAEGQELADIMAGMKLYVRGNGNSSNKAYYVVDGVVTDNQAYGSKLKDNAVDCGDGWYYVEVSIPAADSYFINLNAEDVSGAKLGEGCLYVDICVNGTPVTTVLGLNSGEELTAEKVEKPQLPVVDEPTVDVTPDEPTVDVTPEETGAISIAVVAMVAIMGGAVVLKKKEF